ncbi:MAG: PfkB family carbohydrate kinase [Aurantimicrobium sp.]
MSPLQRPHNQRVILNAAPAFSVDEATLRVCDPLVVNEHEAEVVLGEKLDNYERVAQALRGKGARSVVITLGGDGAVAADEDGVFRIPAYEVDVVDTTGAGDAFVGALASELSAGTTLRGAMEFATAMSAIAVQKHGAQPSYVTRNVVEAFISENQTRSQ